MVYSRHENEDDIQKLAIADL